MTLRDATVRAATDRREGSQTLEPLLSARSVLWYIRLRWVFIATPLAGLGVERLLRANADRPPEIFMVLAALALLNVIWWLTERAPRVRNSPTMALRLTHAQIAADLVILTALVRFTGGYESPLTIFYVFHVVFAALLLPPRGVIAQAVWTIVLFAGLAAGEVSGIVAPYYPPIPTAGAVHHPQGAAYAVAMVAAVAAGVLGTHYLTGSIAARLRRREAQLETVNAHLRTSQEVIRELQERRSRFMQTAAHRLKSPLATVQTLAGLIRDGVVAESEYAETYGCIARCCNEGILHVTELLTLARVQDADPARHDEAQAEVGQLVLSHCVTLQAVAAKRGIRLEWSVPGGENLAARVDPRDLGECIENVLDNGLKYTPSGGTVRVAVERFAAGAGGEAWIAIRVDDSGIGFDADLLRQFNRDGTPTFDAYRRGNNALAAGITGSGLGLAIVGAVVEQAGGRIEVRSEPDRGTSFTLKFRAAESAAIRGGSGGRAIATGPPPALPPDSQGRAAEAACGGGSAPASARRSYAHC